MVNEVRASHILVDKEMDARKIIEKLKDGAKFETQAQKWSSCPSKAKGGDLGYFGRGSMVKPFEDAAFALEVGEISQVVTTEYGFHVIQVVEKQEGTVLSFDEVRDDLKEFLTQSAKIDALEALVQELREDADVVIVGQEPGSTQR